MQQLEKKQYIILLYLFSPSLEFFAISPKKSRNNHSYALFNLRLTSHNTTILWSALSAQ